MKKRSEPNFYEELTESSIYDLSSDYRQNNYFFKNEVCEETLDYREFLNVSLKKSLF